MKSLCLLAAFCLLTLILPAQNPQQLVNVPLGTYWSAPAWLYLPADYNTTTSNYPVVIFFHGAGESGTDPNRVLNQGIPRLISQGMRPDSILNPVDGQRYSFIVLSAQAQYWSPPAEWLPLELDWLKQNYRIDTNRVYISGLSAGGQSAFMTTATSPELSRLVAAAAVFSPAVASNYDVSLLNTYHIRTWFLSGATDPNTTNAQTWWNQINSVFPGSSKLNIYPGGHCCWSTYYNKNWHDTATGLSIWEWFLTNQRALAPGQTLAVYFSDLKVSDLGNRRIRVSFACAEGGGEDFYIRLTVRGNVRKILVRPEDRTGPGRYSKIINLDQ